MTEEECINIIQINDTISDIKKALEKCTQYRYNANELSYDVWVYNENIVASKREGFAYDSLFFRSNFNYTLRLFGLAIFELFATDDIRPTNFISWKAYYTKYEKHLIKIRDGKK